MKNYRKYGTEELMELVDVFNVSEVGAAKIRVILAEESAPPDAGVFFRYYNDRSKVEEFEKLFAAHVGAKYVLAVNSGTSALIAALVAAGVGPGDEVIVPAYTFFASASAVVMAKAIPVIADINESLMIDPDSIEKLITPRTKAIIPVHMLGFPCEMDRICEIAVKHNLTVVEDTAQACGAMYKGKYLGTWGDFGCISLDAYKVIGSGEGGILTCKDDFEYMRAQSYHDTAACWRPDRYGKERVEGELFCGENYRMSELSAAVALAQLRKLDWVNARTRYAYHKLQSLISLPKGVKWVMSNDPEGMCGYTLAMLFDSKDMAVAAQNAGVVGGNAANATKGVRDWHMAWNWEQILAHKTATAEGCPFKCPFAKDVPVYTRDSWPISRDIMMRVGTISTYPNMSDEDIAKTAERVNEGLAKCLK